MKVLALAILLELVDCIQEVKSCHVVGVGLSHLDEVDLEALVEFLPHAEVLVLRVSEELEAFSNSEQCIPLLEVKKELFISEIVERLGKALEVSSLFH